MHIYIKAAQYLVENETFNVTNIDLAVQTDFRLKRISQKFKTFISTIHQNIID